MFKQARKKAWDSVKRGNLFILAIGLLIGLVFNDLVKSLANDIILNPIAKNLKFENLQKWETHGVLIGNFLATLLTFIIVLFVVFVLMFTFFIIVEIKNSRKKVVEEAPAEPVKTTNELILEEIRELKKTLAEEMNKEK